MKWIKDRRIWIDQETKEILDPLSDNYIYRDSLLYEIICNWVCNEKKKCERGYGFKNGIIYTGCLVSRLYLNIDDVTWENFLDICLKRELSVSVGFKNAVFDFIENF